MNLLAFDLREEIDLRVEVERRDRGGGADQDRRLQPHDPFPAKPAAQVHDLPEERVEQLAEPRVVLLGALQQDATAHGVETVEGFAGEKPAYGTE